MLSPQPEMITPVQKDGDLIEDFQQADNVTGALHLWWLGHSGFLIKWNGHGILIDPYLSDSLARQVDGKSKIRPRLTERVANPLSLAGIDLVLATHNHLSHLDPETILGIRAASPRMKMVVPEGIRRHVDALLGTAGPPLLPVDSGKFIDLDDIEVHGITAANPEVLTDDHGAARSLGYVVRLGPFIVFHSGDTLWHNSLVKEVRRWNVNLALLPISGDEPEKMSANLNGFQAAALGKAISAGLIVPCHYDMFDDDTASPEEFIYSSERLEQKFRILEPGMRMTMGPMIDPSSGQARPTEAYSTDWGLGY